MNKHEIYEAMRNGAKVVENNATGTYTMNGEKLRKNSVEWALNELNARCKQENGETETTYSYQTWMGGSRV